MKFEFFYHKIKTTIQDYGSSNPSLSNSCSALLVFLDGIVKKDDLEVTLRMTQVTILFEGFYRSVLNDYPLKNKLTELRLERWGDHYGTPTITFLLTYTTAIEQTKVFFNKAIFSTLAPMMPWENIKRQNLLIDEQNNVAVDVNSLMNVTMPTEDEKTGQFLKTHNPSGGFATTPCDPVSKKFIEYANNIAKNGGTVLEIGAAFGAASLEALAKGTRVFCNDIEPNNLAVIRNRFLKITDSEQSSTTGDASKLVLVPGKFPEELAGLPKNFFDAILISRVLHFFTGEQIERALLQLSEHLKPGGKLFVVCETPFLKNWQRFIPEHQKRVEDGVKWPGEINDPAAYENSGRAVALPQFVHWLTKEILERSLKQSKFCVEHLSYIDRCGQFPNDLLLDGRESIGAVAAKPC